MTDSTHHAVRAADSYDAAPRKIRLYDTLRQSKEEFAPLAADGRVSMYVCGLTPYDHPHLGHAFTAVRFEMIRNYLEYRNLPVRFVTNVTDIEDKIINRSRETGEDPRSLSERFTAEYFEGLGEFGVRPPEILTKVSTSLTGIKRFIEELIARERAYATPEGNVYFSIGAHPRYGKLSRQRVEELRVRVRETENDTSKRDPLDFALWKRDDSLLAVESPWGKGRPGWHIECSAMILEALGPTIDIHGGGLDLKFPHHENEIAQSEAHNDAPFVNFWMHAGLLSVDGVKMSKSLGNFFTLRDALDRFGPELLKFVMLRYHYRSQVDFSDKLFRDNLNALAGLSKLLERTESIWTRAVPTPSPEAASLVASFEDAMDNDLGTPEAVVHILKYADEAQASLESDGKLAEALVPYIYGLSRVLGLFTTPPAKVIEQCIRFSSLAKNAETPLSRAELDELLKTRATARASKDYAVADAVRSKLTPHGLEALDRKDGGIAWRFA